MTRWYEDIPVDSSWEVGTHTFAEDEILAFGRAYDPQYFHTDPELAKESHFGGLIASGWHTASVGQRLMIDRLSLEADRIRAAGEEPGEAGPSPGIMEMDFSLPVRPGDTISYHLTVLSKRPSKSLPGWGVLTYRIEAHNQDDALVYRQEFAGFTRIRRPKLSPGQWLKMMIGRIPAVQRARMRRG